MKNMQDRYKAIGLKIRTAREDADMSQKELAEKVGFESSTAISLIETGDRKVSVKDLESIALILHKDIKFFLGQEEGKADVRFALRADKELSTQDKQQILSFIDFVKKQKHGKSGK